MLLRFLGQGGRRRLAKEIELPIEQMTDEWLLRAFFDLKKEGMRRKLLSRYGYKRKVVQDGKETRQASIGANGN